MKLLGFASILVVGYGLSIGQIESEVDTDGSVWQRMKQQIDTNYGNRDGKVDKEEVANFMYLATGNEALLDPDNIPDDWENNTFWLSDNLSSKFDKDGSYDLSPDEFKELMETLTGEELDKEQLDNLVEYFDVMGDGMTIFEQDDFWRDLKAGAGVFEERDDLVCENCELIVEKG